MEAIYILIPISLVLLIVAVLIFFWAVNSNQYSDLKKESTQFLIEEAEDQKRLEEKARQKATESKKSTDEKAPEEKKSC